MSDVKPALTAEEWADPPYMNDGKPWWFCEDTFYEGEIENPHAVAAVCLHEQSFGFTRKDVRVLRMNAEEADRTSPVMDVSPPIRGGDHLRSLADRIEALLPTEDV